MKLFIHGIPDTPLVWSPLLSELSLKDSVAIPPVPGLAEAAPPDFPGTPDAYVDWLIGEVETAYGDGGPVDLIGHDWGALFTVRVACLRPELLRSWTAVNAVPDPEDPWPLVARLWATPGLGKLLMALSPSSTIEKALARQRMSEGMAAHEAAHWKRESRRAVRRLYRTGIHIGAEWDSEIPSLHPKGLVIWGDKDPYARLDIAERFCARTGAVLETMAGCGHWSIVEAPDRIARTLKAHWKG